MNKQVYKLSFLPLTFPPFRVIYKFKGGEKCATPHLTEDALKEYTRTALSFLIENREALIEDGRLIKAALTDRTEIDAELQAVTEELEIVAQMIEKAISTNAITALDQDEYAKRTALPNATQPYKSVIRLLQSRERTRNIKRMSSAVSFLNSESLNFSTPNGRIADSAPPSSASPFTMTDALYSPSRTAARRR